MIAKFKWIVEKISLIKDSARLLYWKFLPPISSESYWINKIVNNDDLTLVQIGSNDGKTGDPFFKLIKQNTKWKVLFVEPVPYLFERLKNNYPAEPRFRFENVAINDGSKQTFYWVKEETNKNIQNLPKGYDQLGSFDRYNIIKHFNGKLEPYIVASDMQGMILDELFIKSKIDKLDILHIDTEGYDWKILSQLDLIKYTPALILFEHINLQNAEREQSIKFLKDLYHIFQFGGDFLCIRRDKNKLRKRELQLLLKLQCIRPVEQPYFRG